MGEPLLNSLVPLETGPRKRLHVGWAQYTRFRVPNSLAFSSNREMRSRERWARAWERVMFWRQQRGG